MNKDKIKIVNTNFSRLIIITIIVFFLMSVLNTGKFFTIRNVESMSFQFPELGLLCLGMMLAMLTAGIDLSIVGIANLSAIMAALIMTKIMPEDASVAVATKFVIYAIIVGLLTGVLCGAFNGFLISKVGISAILATLGTQLIFTGIGVVITKGTAISGYPKQFTKLGNGTIGIFPIPLIIFAICAILLSLMLRKTKMGTELYLIGTNPKAAIFSGIKSNWVIFRSYIITGLLGATAGLVMISRTNSAKYDYASSYILQTVLIAVLGGVNPNGGFGTVGGVTIAVLSLQFLGSGFNMLRFSMFAKDFIWGLSLIHI